MRAALIIGLLCLVPLVLVGFGLRYTGELEVVTREYDSYEAASADRVFGGGWLPDVIPASATRMVVTGHLDLNTGRGEFRYDPADTDAFLARLRPWQGGPAPFEDDAARVAGLESRGYRAYQFTTDGSVWVFFVNAEEGHVAHDMWPAPPTGGGAQDDHP